MRSTFNYYSLSLPDFAVLSDEKKMNSLRVLHDTSLNSMEEYFENSYKVFMLRLEQFKNLHRSLTVQEEKELSFMLDALMAAKNILGSVEEKRRQ